MTILSIIGLIFIGFIIGIAAMCLFHVAGRADEQTDSYFKNKE